MKDLLKSYSKRLSNLTARNRSLYLLRLQSRYFIDLHRFNFLNGSNSFSIIEKLISGKQQVVSPEFDSRDKDVNVLSKELKRLIRADRFLFEEQGTQDLHVGWPFIRGKFADGTAVRTALLYIPVRLQLKNNEYILQPRKEEGISLNKSFLLAYGHYNEVRIPDEVLEFNTDELDPDITVFRTGIYQFLKDAALEINFNRDNFMDELKSFEEFKKADFQAYQEAGELKMYPEAVLGIFPQADSNLVPDYQNLIEKHEFQDLEDFFGRKTLSDEDQQHSEFFYKNRVSEEKTFTPYEADAYQEDALRAVKKGYSIVVQGPPGTGKSQLICNLLADFSARGKKVLVVSQKRAALDVVFERLKEKNLHDFAGIVHDFKGDRKNVFEKIARQIRKIPEYESNNNSLDLVQLERKFLQLSRRIDQITEELEEFKTALYDKEEFGISAKELYLFSDKNASVISLRQEYQFFDYENLPDFLIKLRQYALYGKKYNQTDYALLERKSFAGYGISELKKMENVLEEIPLLQEKVKKQSKDILDSPIDIETAEFILSRRSKIIEMLNILKEPRVYRYFTTMNRFSDGQTDLLWLSNSERVLMECYKGHGPELSLPADQLGKFQEVLERILEARRRVVKLIRWNLFSEDKYLLKRVLVANGLKNNKKDLAILVEKVDNRLNLEHNLSKLREIKWLKDIPMDIEKLNLQNWFHDQKEALRAKLIFNSVRGIKEYFNLNRIEYEELNSKLERLFTVIHEIPERKHIWELYFHKTHISNLLNDPSLAQRIKNILNRDFDSLCEFDDLKDNLKDYELSVLDNVIDSTESDKVEEIEANFINSLYIAWINHIEAKYPLLRSVSSQKFMSLESELIQAVDEKLSISNEILLLKLREQTYESVEYNRLKNRVTYRDLDHQVNKKRRLWPLRKVIAEYHYELFNLMPCWLASPESVSALFPMNELFDLVIFDEASQCFTEKGIPAMFRGKQVVIAGDSRQLRPNDLYTIRYEEDEGEDPNLEISSVLDLAERHLMSIPLKGHYRSQAMELIEFSNRHFYEGKLVMLPDRNKLNQNEPAIQYIKIDGEWLKSQNIPEAEEVVKLIGSLLETKSQKSIGIVTFNHPQQELIQDLLETWSLENKIALPDSLFVKNIENVQGDERDIIVFSVGYAPDKSGRMTMQFGSLNMEFGENRLNVAISRAREYVYIVSSILPQQLNVEETKNLGPKLFKDYLAFAWEVSLGNYTPKFHGKRLSADWYLKSKIQAELQKKLDDISLEGEMPFADLTVSQNDKYVALIQTDDDHYMNSPSVKDAHVYRPSLLSLRNWEFKRVMSRQYWNHKEEVLESLLTFVTNKAIRETERDQ